MDLYSLILTKLGLHFQEFPLLKSSKLGEATKDILHKIEMEDGCAIVRVMLSP